MAETSPVPPTVEQLERLIAKWQPRLGIQHWTIWAEVGSTAREDSAWTSMQICDFNARVTFRSDYWEIIEPKMVRRPGQTDEDIIEQTVIHELMHVVQEAAHDPLKTEVEWIAGKDGCVGSELRNRLGHFTEHVSNALEHILLEADRTHGWSAAKSHNGSATDALFGKPILGAKALMDEISDRA